MYCKQFPNTRFLYLGVSNRRISSQYLFENTKKIIEQLQFLIYLELYLTDDCELSTDFIGQLNFRIKKHSIGRISQDMTIYLWF